MWAGPVKLDRTTEIAIRHIARYVAETLITRKYGITYLKKHRKEARRLAEEIKRKWLEEITLNLHRQV